MGIPISSTSIIVPLTWGVLLRRVPCYNLAKEQVRRQEMAVRLRVKEVAREKGISMGKLHRQADVSYKTIKRIYSDPFYATTTITLGKLAKVLGVPPGDLIEEVPDDREERAPRDSGGGREERLL
jgi:DNA-binding Xre family transcriptional regulator